MRLTPELVARIPPGGGGEPFTVAPEGMRLAGEPELASIARSLLESAPDPSAIWVFAYGSLIWKPAFEHSEHRIALVRGWRRRFCLGWDRMFRGSDDRPGLMLALDRGGQCRGVAYRIPPGMELEALTSLARREMRLLPHPFPPRWLRVQTDFGQVMALAFVIDRNSGRYVGDLDVEATARVLATAAGPAGSMAEYLHATVRHLQQHGIHDHALWALQDRVARLIEQEV